MGDAIDSNGDYLQDGGNVNLITISNGKCLDYEGKCEIKSGSLFCNGETYDIIS